MDLAVTYSWRMLGGRRGVAISCGILLGAAAARAQYDEERVFGESPERYLYAGVEMRDFRPRGVNTALEPFRISFRHTMPYIGLRQGLVDVQFGYAPYTLHGRSRSAVFIATTVGREIPILRGYPHALTVPVLVAADYTKAESIGTRRDDFNVGSIGIGGGIRYRLLGSSVDFSFQTVEVVQFSFEGLGTGTGFSACTIAEASALLKTVPVFDGLAVGYRFRYQTWAMNDHRYSYRVISHGPYLGVIF